MSHAFLSYSHKDKDTLQTFLEFIKGTELTNEIWYDRHLEAGSRWEPQIDNALDEAYALIVLVTENSMASMYVTYEWSAAIGRSIPVFPLIFTEDRKIIHDVLLRIQYFDCTRGIPTEMVDAILARRTAPPELRYLNINIMTTYARFLVGVYVVHWYFGLLDDVYSDYQTILELVEGVVDEAREVYSVKLPDLLTSKSHAFGQKQLRMTRMLVDALQEYWFMFHVKLENSAYYIAAEPISVLPGAVRYFEDDFTRIIDYFQTDHQYADALRDLKQYLVNLSDGKKPMALESFWPGTRIIEWVYEKDSFGQRLLEVVARVQKNIEDKSGQ